MARYQVIPRTLIFVFHQERILLLRGSPHKKNFPNLYNGLGGHIEHGESVLAAAQRELTEESGLMLNDLSLCGILIDKTNADIGVEVHIFKGTLDHLNSDLIPSIEGELGWYTREEAAALDMVPDVPHYLDHVWNWQPGERLYYGLVDWKNTHPVLE